MGMARGDTSSEEIYEIYIAGTESTFEHEEDFSDECNTTETENPQSTRAFVAIWDPTDDVLFLSHPNSDRGSFLTAKAALYPPESISDLHSLSVPSVPPSSRSSLFYYHFSADDQDDQDEPFFGPLTLEQRSLKGMTQTSSTLGGLDVYLKGQALSYTHRHQPVYSVLDFSTDFHFDAGSVGLGQNGTEGACIVRKSGIFLNTSFPQHGFSMEDDRCSVSWSTVESPSAEEIESMKKPAESLKPRSRRRLKKKRPDDLSLSRQPVIESSGTDVPSPVPQHCITLGRHKGILKGILNIGSLKRRVDKDWIWVEASKARLGPG